MSTGESPWRAEASRCCRVSASQLGHWVASRILYAEKHGYKPFPDITPHLSELVRLIRFRDGSLYEWTLAHILHPYSAAIEGSAEPSSIQFFKSLEERLESLADTLLSNSTAVVSAASENAKELSRPGADPNTWKSKPKLILLDWLITNPKAVERKVIIAAVVALSDSKESSVRRSLDHLNAAGWLDQGECGTCLSAHGIRKAKKSLKKRQ